MAGFEISLINSAATFYKAQVFQAKGPRLALHPCHEENTLRENIKAVCTTYHSLTPKDEDFEHDRPIMPVNRRQSSSCLQKPSLANGIKYGVWTLCGALKEPPRLTTVMGQGSITLSKAETSACLMVNCAVLTAAVSQPKATNYQSV